MVRYDLIPTKKVREEARNKGEDPRYYLNNKTYRISPDQNGDLRKMDKYGIEYLEDIMITRTDGSKVIIHQIGSDIENLEKLELSEVNDKNEIFSKKLAYTEGLDFGKMQNDVEYLNLLGDQLLSKERLSKKEQEANLYGNDEIYIGHIGINPRTNTYSKYAYHYDKIANMINEAKEKRKREEEIRMNNRNNQKMILAISQRLKTLSSEELSQICTAMDISLEDLSKDDDREY